MKFALVYVYFTFLLTVKQIYTLNSYIYLPDKTIVEEIPVGSLVVDLADELNAYYTKISVKPLTVAHQPQQYTFLEDVKQTSENSYFLLDTITGRITTKRYLDRESLCLNRHCIDPCDTSYARNNCKINLKILLIPSYTILSVNIFLQDINDNKPQFRNEFMNQSIPENVPIGYRIPLDLAYDPDYGINSIQYYAFVDTTNQYTSMALLNDTFELVQNLSESQLALIVKKKLDREAVESYHFIIAAYDGGTPPFFGQLEVYIEITDINDNNPKFKQDVYKFSVLENTEIGSQIGDTIQATDADAGLNGKIKYSIVNIGNGAAAAASLYNVQDISVAHLNQQNYYMKYFDIDEDTGVLRLKWELDYETEQFYSLTIEAKDCGIGSLPAYANVEIYVIDCNDNKPEISVSFLNTLKRETTADNETIVQIQENMQPNKYIAHVSIFDKDSNENGRIEWKVFINGTELNDNSLILVNRLNNNSFTLNSGVKSLTTMDRERLSNFNISILAWDNGVPKSQSFYNFTFVLQDENDNAPQFDKSKYEFKIMENNHPFDIIGSVSAFDMDIGENSRMTYSIKEIEMQKVISIDFNGTIRALKIFDREEIEMYKFYVIASDNGKPVQSTSVLVQLFILDQNDNAPKIMYETVYTSREQLPDRQTLVLSIDELISPGTQIARFTYSDADEGVNGKGRFFMQQRDFLTNTLQQAQLPFKLTSDGVLTVENNLDREKVSSYEFTVVCQDFGVKPESYSSELNIIIYLNDVNDNCPVCVNITRNGFINKDDYFDVSHSSSSSVYNATDANDKFLFHSTYMDLDVGKNAELKFDLLTYDDLFEIIQTQIRIDTRVFIHIKFKFKIFNFLQKQQQSQEQTFEKFLKNLKLGKYVLRLKISDNGDPSCIINESYVLVIGDNDLNRVEILNKLKILDRKTLLFVNDNENDVIYLNNTKGNSKVMHNSKSVSADGVRVQKSQYKLTSNDYLLLIALIVIVVIIAIFFSLIATVYFYGKYKKQMRKKSDTMAKIHAAHLETGKLLAGNHLDSPDNTEILYHDNRYSFSVKSTESDRSNSADSVLSSAYTKETKSTSNSYHIDTTMPPPPHGYHTHKPTSTYKNYTLSTFDGANDVQHLKSKHDSLVLDHSHLYSTLNSYNQKYLTISQIKDRQQQHKGLLSTAMPVMGNNSNRNSTANIKYKYSNREINSLYQNQLDDNSSDIDDDGIFVSQKSLHKTRPTVAYDYKSSAV